jgi:hypothetical protein
MRNAVGELELLSGQKFPNRNEENPALVLSSVYNRTSARDGPIFGSKGLSMYTTSLVRNDRKMKLAYKTGYPVERLD